MTFSLNLSVSSVKLNSIISLLRLNKPIGILLLLWPTLMALWVAGGAKPSPKIVWIFIAGVVVMRSAGCVINDLSDRKFDQQVARTCNRPLAQNLPGGVTILEAKLLFMLLLMIALFLVLQLNRHTILLSGIGLFLATAYPFMKRYIQFPQAVLGLAFGWGIPMVYAALDVPIRLDTWLLFLANFCWIVAYDTQYAMADREDDIKAGVKSTAILFGRYDCLWIGFFQAIALSLWIGLGIILGLGVCYYVGVLLALCLFVYHQGMLHNKKPDDCFKAFLHNQYVGMVLFMGLCLDGWFFR